METALQTYHKLGKELEAETTDITPEQAKELEEDVELTTIAERLDVLVEEMLGF